jgi:phosphoenolpyruvate synthase/pyruvate phosphate dikinase
VNAVDLQQEYVVETVECHPHQLLQVGGKSVGLGSLLRAGQRVPDSFVVTAAAYADWLVSEPRRMSDSVRAAIEEAYRGLFQGDDVTVAVRSSATIEDSSESSCAGQFRTFLGAGGVRQVVEQVEECWLSAFAPHVDSYRADRVHEIGAAADASAVAVIVQELVDARVAGVMFTQHPLTGDRSLVVIEASYGLGEAVVGGEVTPDLFEVNKVTQQLHRRSLGTKPHEHRLADGAHTVATLAVSADRQGEWSLDDNEIMALLSMAGDLEAKLGRGLDIEWAIGTAGDGGEELFALQVRPITVSPRRASLEGGPQTDAIAFTLGRLAGRAMAAEPDGKAGS